MDANKTMGMLKLKRSFELVWCGNECEIRDSARNHLVVYTGTYEECVKEAKRRGIWYS